ncbi:hypothetical protein OIU84_028266 [Salix udensis]|uniref:Uncharacterized protein n=1 Tax=Salix udensis TaxID=889485 RepID=A0AAD6KC66_9ROSI|nr:hypothetical protein OIU84_028266 [Salix udensis]
MSTRRAGKDLKPAESSTRGRGYNGERKYEGGDYAIPKPTHITDGIKIHPKEILLTYSPYPALPLHTDVVEKHSSTAHTIKHHELFKLGKTLATVEGMLRTEKEACCACFTKDNWVGRKLQRICRPRTNLTFRS